MARPLGAKDTKQRNTMNYIPWNKNLKLKPLSVKHRQNISVANSGKQRTVTQKQHMSAAKLGTNNPMYGKQWNQNQRIAIIASMLGTRNWRWISDRTQLKTYANSDNRRSPRYRDWRNSVCNRDSLKCKINNADCNGRLEVHHILGYEQYPSLRYDINNGITLCHGHHPRKRADELKLSPYFKQLVSEK